MLYRIGSTARKKDSEVEGQSFAITDAGLLVIFKDDEKKDIKLVVASGVWTFLEIEGKESVLQTKKEEEVKEKAVVEDSEPLEI